MNISIMLDELQKLLAHKESKISEEVRNEIAISWQTYIKSKNTFSDATFFLNSLQLSVNKMGEHDQLKFLKLITPCSLSLLKEVTHHLQLQTKPQQEEKENVIFLKNSQHLDMMSRMSSNHSKMSTTSAAQARNQQAAANLLSPEEKARIIKDLGKKRAKLISECRTLKSDTTSTALEHLSLYLLFKRDIAPALILQFFKQKYPDIFNDSPQSPLAKLAQIDKELGAESVHELTHLPDHEIKKIYKNISSFIAFKNTLKNGSTLVNEILKHDFKNIAAHITQQKI